jgi:Nucleotidyl transferase of unknown function (DUF2204)
MHSYSTGPDPQAKYYSRAWTFYRHALTVLQKQQVPFLVGGTYALEQYTGIKRNTKDLDIFVMPKDCNRVLEDLTTAGYQTELEDPQWLGQVICGDDFIDVIFGPGNHLTPVDELWFEHAVEGNILDIPVKLCAPEEIIWPKAFIMDRKRYDGADIAHLLRSCSEQINWPRLLHRFGPHWRVLLSHLILFGFIYPDERSRIPDWIMQELLYRAQNELSSPILADRRCLGPFLSETEYLADIEHWGYQDARLVAQEQQDQPKYCDLPLLPNYALWSKPLSGSMQN